MMDTFFDLDTATAIETAKAVGEGQISALEACDAAVEIENTRQFRVSWSQVRVAMFWSSGYP